MIKKIQATQPIADFVKINGYNVLAINEIIWRCDNNGVNQPFIIGKLVREMEKEPVSKPNPFSIFKSNSFDRPISFGSLFR